MTDDTLNIVQPLKITSEKILTSNVPVSMYELWSSTKTYSDEDRVYVASNEHVYQSVADENVGHDPTTPLSKYWVEVGPVNRFAAFDYSFGTKTQHAYAITYTLKPGEAIDTFAAVALQGAKTLHLLMKESDAKGAPIVYDKTFDLTREMLDSDWWHFFFGNRSQPNQLAVWDLPDYPNATLTVTISGDEDLAVGTLLVGTTQRFGFGVSLGSRVGIRDYSRKEINEFGQAVLVRRQYAHRMNLELLIRSEEVDFLQNFLADIRALPVLWSATKKYRSMTFVGFYKNFETLINYPDQAVVEIEIEGIP